MRILFVTDIHGVVDHAPRLAEQARDMDVLILGGDLTNFGGARDAMHVVERLRRGWEHVLCVPGNLDHLDVLLALESAGISLHGRGVMLHDVGIHGLGGSNRTPFRTPFEFEDDEMQRLLQQGYESVRHASVRILVAHPPPIHTCADRLASGKHVGSLAVRAFIESKLPSACLSGHIHESVCVGRLGPTWVVNPGPFAAGRYATVQIDSDALSCEIRTFEGRAKSEPPSEPTR